MNTATDLEGLVSELKVQNLELRKEIEQIKGYLSSYQSGYQRLQDAQDYLEENYANLVDKYVVVMREIREIKLQMKKINS